MVEGRGTITNCGIYIHLRKCLMIFFALLAILFTFVSCSHEYQKQAAIDWGPPILLSRQELEELARYMKQLQDSSIRGHTYQEGQVGEAVVEGKITFKGIPPPPKLHELALFPQSSFCGEVDNDGKGHRMQHLVTVNNGALSDVVVYIRNITKGKPFTFNGTDVKIDHCRFLVQGGPSTFVGVVVKGAEFRVLNEDADPSDPKSTDGVLHNPHGYEAYGHSSHTMFNKPLPTKGEPVILRNEVRLREPDGVMFLQCDQHSYEEAWFYPVENPYYSIVGPDGTYSIDQVPPGKYKLLAWHPMFEIQEKEIEVGATGKVTVNFEFSK